MNVLITEQQNKIILLEGMSDIMSTIFEHGADFSANLYKRIMKRYKFNLKILLTFVSSFPYEQDSNPLPTGKHCSYTDTGTMHYGNYKCRISLNLMYILKQ